jgi:hypothetical protein
MGLRGLPFCLMENPPGSIGAGGMAPGWRRRLATGAVMSALVVTGVEGTAVTGVMPEVTR